MSGLCAEIKAGGIKGCLGLDQIDWGESRGGKFFEFWKTSPCCGSPWDVNSCVYCLASWWFCGLCSSAKLCGSSLGQPCSIVPHCLCVMFCPPLSMIAMRYNIRKKAGVTGNIIGDLVCMYFCGCFTCCQLLRAVPRSDWDLLPFHVEIVAPRIQFLR